MNRYNEDGTYSFPMWLTTAQAPARTLPARLPAILGDAYTPPAQSVMM